MIKIGISKEEKKLLKKIGKSVKQKLKGSSKDIPGMVQNFYLIEGDQITKLVLSGERPPYGQELKGPKVKIPEEIGELTALKSLTLSYLVFDSLPESIGNLKDMRHFTLNHVTVPELPDAIGNFTQLEKFYMMYCQCPTLPESVGNWTQVKEVLIQNSKTRELPPTVRHWTNVELVQLRDCLFEKIPLGICGWTNIKRLWLHANPLMRREDGDLVRRAQSWGLNGYSEIVDAGVPYLLRELYERYQAQYPNDPFEFQENPAWQNFAGVFHNREPYLQWQLENYSKYELLNIADIFKYLKMYEEAKAFYKRILQIENLQNATQGLMEIEELTMPLEEKEKLYEERAAAGGLQASNWLGKLAGIKIELKKYDEAIQILKNLTQQVPKHGPSWLTLGKCYINAGNNKEAKKCFETLLDLVQNYHNFGYTVDEIQGLINQVS